MDYEPDWTWFLEYLDTIEAALAELAELRKASQNASALPTWRPIESAPKGKCILLTNGKSVGTASLSGNPHVWLDQMGYMDFPTHWMPLPTPPAKESSHDHRAAG